MTFDLDMERNRLARKVKALQAKDHIPAPLLELLRKVNELQLEARPHTRLDLPPAQSLAPGDQRAQGAPLLVREEFPHDPDQAARLFDSILGLMAGSTPQLADSAAVISQAVAAKELDPGQAFLRFIEADTGFFEAWAEKTPQAPLALHFLVQAALSPSLAEASRLLARDLDLNASREHGHCPVCGSPPLMGSLRGKEGKRYLTCSFCLADYRVTRIMCVFCGERNMEKLAFFQVEEEPGYRVDVCRICNSYLKVADFRKLDKASLPLWDDLESISLDILAAKDGYQRSTLSGWGF